MSLYDAYVRVSRRGDRVELRSPGFQQDAIRVHAEREGFDVEWLAPEIDVSGSKASRPILDELVHRIEAGETDGLVVWRLDRLSRLPARERAELFDRIEGAGGQVRSATEPLDNSTPQGRLMRDLFLGIARMQWEQSAEGWDTSKLAALARGVHIAAAPYGYLRQKGHPLEINPDTAPLVCELFERRARGQSWRSLATWLRAQPNGRGTTPAAVRRIVQNRTYLGEARGRRDDVKLGAHPAIVDAELFDAAQAPQARPARGAAHLPPGLLSGLLRCAGCGHTMTISSTRGARGNRVRYYACRGNAAAGRCPAKASISTAKVEPVIEAAVLAHLRDRWVSARETNAKVAQAVERRDAATKELAAYVAQESALGEFFLHGFEDRKRALADAEVAVRRLRGNGPVPALQNVVEDVWPSLSAEERRTILRGAIGLMWVRKGHGQAEDRVRLVAPGFEPDDLPARGFAATARTMRPFVWTDDLPGEIAIPGIENADESAERAVA